MIAIDRVPERLRLAKEKSQAETINYDKVDKVRGMTVTITTTATTNEHARALLAEMGMPFRK